MPLPAAAPSSDDRPLLDVKGLTTRFLTEEGVVHAVENVSFHLMPGETLGIVGESGCGKSMTGLSIMRLVPDPPGRIVSGEVVFDGVDLLKLSDADIRDIRGAKIAMIFQDPMTSLNPVLTIGRQITESLVRHTRMNGRQARQRAIDLLALVGIPQPDLRIDQFPHQFSGGMRQRVVIAIALACNPQLIIADEPTTALDVTIQAQILDLLRSLQSEHRSGVMLITHSMGVVAGMADRVQVMYAGSVVETAPTTELFDNPRHPYTVGLMRSIPRVDAGRHERLRPIQGLPPDLVHMRDACPFAPRCAWARPKCREQRPPLLEVAPSHTSACWYWQDVTPSPPEMASAAS